MAEAEAAAERNASPSSSSSSFHAKANEYLQGPQAGGQTRGSDGRELRREEEELRGRWMPEEGNRSAQGRLPAVSDLDAGIHVQLELRASEGAGGAGGCQDHGLESGRAAGASGGGRGRAGGGGRGKDAGDGDDGGAGACARTGGFGSDSRGERCARARQAEHDDEKKRCCAENKE
eukprot:737005-Hanusia_phi.AAC.2